MLCSNCGKNEATIMYSENINGVKKQMNLCEKCAKKLGVDTIDFSLPVSFSNFFGNMLEDFQMSELMPMIGTSTKTKCSNCGYSIEDIINDGQFGCANCYDTFDDEIDSIIKRFQGSNRHVGRLGNVSKNKIDIIKENKNDEKNNELDKLERNLKKAIKEERYEDAAKIRDEIAKKKKSK